MKGRVCQLFEVFQHEFANLSLPCEGRFKVPIRRVAQHGGHPANTKSCSLGLQRISLILDMHIMFN